MVLGARFAGTGESTRREPDFTHPFGGGMPTGYRDA